MPNELSTYNSGLSTRAYLKLVEGSRRESIILSSPLRGDRTAENSACKENPARHPTFQDEKKITERHHVLRKPSQIQQAVNKQIAELRTKNTFFHGHDKGVKYPIHPNHPERRRRPPAPAEQLRIITSKST
ncbi:hypothetical protein PUN28_010063 [Cardiocondyla obscurior]|uniref:Uncharacterized protein n=1 Tax=Cardiocondyla obscurior TaxID=286306 RepID=A0AAW2FSQ0_9HYME